MQIETKKWIKYAIGGILALVFLLVSYRACNLYDKNSELKGEYKAYKALSVANAKVMKEAISQLEKGIIKRDKQIANSNKEIETKTKKIKELNKTTEQLEKERKNLIDKDEIIVNLESQIEVWKEKFSLAIQTIEEKDKIIFNLTQNYESQLEISQSYKLRVEELENLQQVAGLRIKGLEGSLRKSRLFSGVQTPIIIVLAAIVAVNLAK